MTSTKPDDLEAVRSIAQTIELFGDDDRERILRWVRERLGMAGAPVLASHPVPAPPAAPNSSGASTATVSGTNDIKSFVSEKSPKSDIHFAATVAYYQQFHAPIEQRKDSITKDDLVEACRRVDRKRPTRPAQVLVNAYLDGLFDRSDKGHYKLNSVGENLVAMALPGATTGNGTKKKARAGTEENDQETQARPNIEGEQPEAEGEPLVMLDVVSTIDEAIDAVTRLRDALHRGANRQVRNSDERIRVKATALTWFTNHKPVSRCCMVSRHLRWSTRRLSHYWNAPSAIRFG